MSDPNAPNQSNQYPQYPQYPAGPDERTTSDYDQNNPPNPYGSSAGSYEPRQTQPSGPYEQSGDGAPVPVSPGNPYGQPAAPSGGYPQYQPPYPGYPQYPAQSPSGGYPMQGQPGAPSGAYPQQAPSGPYGQPGAPSGAYPQQGYAGPYSQPLAPGQTGPQGQPGALGAMGQYAPYSQTLPGYGQPGAPSQVGPYDPTIAGQGYPPTGPATPPTPRRSLRAVWIAIAVVVALALVGGGAGYYFLSYLPTQARAAVNSAATAFCADLTSQNYVSAYEATSATLQGQFTQTQFTQDFTTLDKAEGTASTCSGTLSYTYANSTATFNTTLARSTQGSLQGKLHLKLVGSAWKIDAIDTSLLGVNLGAVQTVQAYCAALQSQDYTTAYGLLDSSAQAGTTASAYTTTEQLHDTINGKVTDCSITAVGQGNTDTSAEMTESITRANLAAQTGAVTLSATGSKWLITQLATSAEGEDVGPYLLGQQFCSDLAANDFNSAYNLTSATFQSQVTEAQWQATWEPDTSSGIQVDWTCGKPDLSTYQVSGSSASYQAPLTASIPSVGASNSNTFTFNFTNDGTKWTVDGYPQ